MRVARATGRSIYAGIAAILILSTRPAIADTASSGSTKEVGRLGINETIALALENSPELKASRARASIAALESSNAWSSFLPQLGIKATRGVTGDGATVSQNTAVTAQASAKIYDNGVTSTRYSASLAEQEIADLNYLRERDRLILTVAEAYLRYSASFWKNSRPLSRLHGPTW